MNTNTDTLDVHPLAGLILVLALIILGAMYYVPIAEYLFGK